MKYSYGMVIEACVTAPLLTSAPYTAVNLTNDYGITEKGKAGEAVHDNHALGADMWQLSDRIEDFEIIFDFGGFYPLGKMYVWNYNRKKAELDYTLSGIKNIQIFYSLNGVDWHKAHEGFVTLAKAGGEDNMPATNLVGGEPFSFSGQTARYVKIAVAAKPGVGNYDESNLLSNSFGLSKVRFTMGEGFAVVKDETWSAIMQNNSGWTGSDGVFTIPMDGKEIYGSGADTTITFGDTLIDNVDPVTYKRTDDMHMIHNSSVFLPGSKPLLSDMTFTWGKNKDGTDNSLLNPPLEVQNNRSSAGYYWPQDSVLIDGKCYTYPLTILDWPEGPEGFQFLVDGVAMVISPVENGRIQWEKATHHKTNLYYENPEKASTTVDVFFPISSLQALRTPTALSIYLAQFTKGSIPLCALPVPLKTKFQTACHGSSLTARDGQTIFQNRQALPMMFPASLAYLK